MPVRTPKFKSLIADTSLRPAIAVALVIGLSLPIAFAASRDLKERRQTLLSHLDQDHNRLAEVLAISMQTPIWEVRPDAAQPLAEAIMRDERIVSLKVSATMLPEFLSLDAPERRQGELVTRDLPVMRAGERIGKVEIEMSTRRLEAGISEQWRQVLITGLLQLALGMLIIFPLLRYKVLAPVDRLVSQSRELADGKLDHPLEWRRADELGVLGKTFEATRLSLRNLVRNLEKRNKELIEHQAELAKRSEVLRATLDNMTDGIHLVDTELRLVGWNDRVSEILDVPRDVFREGMPVKDLVDYNLSKRGLSEDERRARFEEWRTTFHPGTASAAHFRTAQGREVDVRRQPMPGGGFVSTFTDVTEQVATQRRQEATFKLLETVMDAVPAVLHVKDRQLRYQMVNQQFLDAWSVSRDQTIGHTNAELFHNEPARRAEERDRQVIETRRALPFYEGSRIAADGSELVTWTTKVPLLDGDGEVEHILTVDLDITDRKRAEEGVKRWLQLFEDAIESLPNGFAVFDKSQSLLTCNSAYAGIYGQPPDELVGASINDLLPRLYAQLKTIDDHPFGEADRSDKGSFEQLWEGRHDRPIEVEFKDGRWMLISRHPTKEGGYATIRTDITQMKAMEHALRDSEALVRRTLESCPVPITMTRAEDGAVIYESPASVELYGKPPPGTERTSRRDHFVADEDRDQFFQALFEHSRVDDLEYEFKRTDDSRFWALVSARLIDYQGERAIVSTTRDLTERKALEAEQAHQREALYQNEKINALGALLAGVAHELNNPLSVVVGQALLLGETADDPKIQKRAEQIGNAANRCSRIVKTFLAMARQSEPERTVVDLNEAIEAALEITGYALRSANIELVCELGEGLPPVWGDGDQLGQVLMNLIINAEQAMAETIGERKLTIRTTFDAGEDRLEVSVADTGPGIPEDVRSRIFEPFFTTKAFGVGTGIGLAVSLGIVQSHGGSLEVSSPAESGAHFILRLPPTKQREVALHAAEETACASGSCCVLVVDDEPEVSEMLAEILSLDGHEIETAPSGNAAMRVLAERSVDVILSDMRMPDVDGPGLYLRIKNAYPKLLERMVFITGDTLGPANRAFLERTGLPYLEKPLSPDEVRQIVQQVLAGAGNGSE
jgi:PAS domain S-box-containing protein